jgi:predicted O-linked N-acetylglucosamine transferase (SPINDLY family)
VQERIRERFAAAGIDAGRLEFLGRSESTREHLGAYEAVDIALDPFPYNGTTTTCEALYMGVPVVTLAGRAHAGRVGVSLLTAAGVPEWVAGSPEEFTRIASGLAADSAGLASLRATLRARLLASALCDARGHAARLEAAYRDMVASAAPAS